MHAWCHRKWYLRINLKRRSEQQAHGDTIHIDSRRLIRTGKSGTEDGHHTAWCDSRGKCGSVDDGVRREANSLGGEREIELRSGGPVSGGSISRQVGNRPAGRQVGKLGAEWLRGADPDLIRRLGPIAYNKTGKQRASSRIARGIHRIEEFEGLAADSSRG